MKRTVLTFLFAAAALTASDVRAESPTAAAKADDIVQRAASAVKTENYNEALTLMRDAYRLDPAPRWLYDLAVLHDHLGECDDAAFFYRAAQWGKGVLPQDQGAVDARLAALEEECHFKKRHGTPADRHARATKFLELKMCTLATAVLTGIATAAEKSQIEQCQAAGKSK